MTTKPYILITNDDGVDAGGIRQLTTIAKEIGEVVVMAPSRNASGQSHSITVGRPLRVTELKVSLECSIYACDGTPADCVKIAESFFCKRRPDIVLSGINAGSNASINELYSGTMGAVREASSDGLSAIGFSLLDYHSDDEFEEAAPFIRTIIEKAIDRKLSPNITLNVNIPNVRREEIKGIQVCRQGLARWEESYEKRIDPYGMPYYWLTGKFVVADNSVDTDLGALSNNYISIVPGTIDSTHHALLKEVKSIFS